MGKVAKIRIRGTEPMYGSVDRAGIERALRTGRYDVGEVAYMYGVATRTVRRIKRKMGA